MVKRKVGELGKVWEQWIWDLQKCISKKHLMLGCVKKEKGLWIIKVCRYIFHLFFIRDKIFE